MPLIADQITLRKIALAKRLYQHAVAQASHHTTTSRVLAVLTFDLASETLLRAAVSALDAKRVPIDHFHSLVQQAEALLSSASIGTLPDRANLHHVHAIRNDVQHKARQPTDNDVSDARTYTRDFLHKLIELLWGLNLDAVSLVDLIQHPQIREHLKNAEVAFESRTFQQTGEQSSIAVSIAFDRVHGVFVGRIPNSVRRLSLEPLLGSAVESDARHILRTFEKLQETVLSIALGLNHADLFDSGNLPERLTSS